MGSGQPTGFYDLNLSHSLLSKEMANRILAIRKKVAPSLARGLSKNRRRHFMTILICFSKPPDYTFGEILK